MSSAMILLGTNDFDWLAHDAAQEEYQIRERQGMTVIENFADLEQACIIGFFRKSLIKKYFVLIISRSRVNFSLKENFLMTKIDLVYLWCDLTDEEWSAKRKRFQQYDCIEKQRQLIADLLIIMNCCFLCVRVAKFVPC